MQQETTTTGFGRRVENRQVNGFLGPPPLRSQPALSQFLRCLDSSDDGLVCLLLFAYSDRYLLPPTTPGAVATVLLPKVTHAQHLRGGSCTRASAGGGAGWAMRALAEGPFIRIALGVFGLVGAAIVVDQVAGLLEIEGFWLCSSVLCHTCGVSL